MAFILKVILVFIFFYLIYQILLKPLFLPKNPFQSSGNNTIYKDSHVNDKTKISKKIDMSKVEDVDYKELD